MNVMIIVCSKELRQEIGNNDGQDWDIENKMCLCREKGDLASEKKNSIPKMSHVLL